MIERLWLYPPLAFARLGPSKQPLESFHWGPNDLRPEGTGKTTIISATTLVVDEESGHVSSVPTGRPRFRDAEGLRPVCPFFELHGEWTVDGKLHTGPITPELLSSFKQTLSRLSWKVEVANLKPFFMTQDADTRIHAEVSARGDDFLVKELRGRSPVGAAQPLVPEGKYLDLGTIRLVNPSIAEVIRLRFHPPQGNIYGPTNFKQREVAPEPYVLADEFLILNPGSVWSRWTPPPGDRRGLPGGQFAQDRHSVSLGLVDDTSDGIISCRLEGTNLVAHARIVVAPPHFAPDRRHVVSIADGLKDRVGRDEVHQDSYFSEEEEADQFRVTVEGKVVRQTSTARRVTALEVNDLMERAFETLDLTNIDALNNRVNLRENPSIAIRSGRPYKKDEQKALAARRITGQHPLPITEEGRQHHRRFSASEIFESMLRQRPTFIRDLVRPPVGDDPFFDFKMPMLMRGSSGEPLHLTRRQYDLLVRWAAELRESIKEGS